MTRFQPTLYALAATTLALFASARAADAPTAPAESTGTDAPSIDELRWTRVVTVLSRVLDGSMNRSELASAIDEHAWAAPFARNRAESARLLPDRLSAAMTLISARAFTFPGNHAAADLIADLERNGTVPAALLRRLKPDEHDDGGMMRAESTLAKWLASTLDATPGTPVGVIALYDDGRRGLGESASTPTLWFVLVRGDVDLQGVPSVSRVLYGPIDAALR